MEWQWPEDKPYLTRARKLNLNLETKRVLITVKAYPSPSRKYQETVCCAGIDIDTKQWLRLYPIPYRDLDESQKFKKYNIIQVQCEKSRDDHRVESYKIDADTIQILDHLDTKDKWCRRKEVVLPTVSPSYCQILRDIEQNKSLGMFQPCNIDFQCKKATLQDEKKREACYAQLTFFNKAKKVIEQIPFDFYYTFKCLNEPECPGHKLTIIDWELGQAYRSWRFKYRDQSILLEKIRERWLKRMCSDKNVVYFYVGNMKRFHEIFMILGVFYPQK